MPYACVTKDETLMYVCVYIYIHTYIHTLTHIHIAIVPRAQGNLRLL
jgi:hypothetical protein